MNELGIREPVLASGHARNWDTVRIMATWLWAPWSIALGVWTAALLTSYPAEFSHETFQPEVGFSLAKSLHVGVYAGFAVLAMLLPLPRGWRVLPIAVLSLHGLLTEYFQQFVPLRYGCWQDVVIDHVGIVLGVLVAWWIERRMKAIGEGK